MSKSPEESSTLVSPSSGASISSSQQPQLPQIQPTRDAHAADPLDEFRGLFDLEKARRSREEKPPETRGLGQGKWRTRTEVTGGSSQLTGTSDIVSRHFIPIRRCQTNSKLLQQIPKDIFGKDEMFGDVSSSDYKLNEGYLKQSAMTVPESIATSQPEKRPPMEAKVPRPSSQSSSDDCCGCSLNCKCCCTECCGEVKTRH